MKRLIISLVLLSVAFSAHAQLFDFSNNANRYEMGLNFGGGIAIDMDAIARY